MDTNVAKLLGVCGSDSDTVFINTGGIWELLYYATDEQFASVIDLYNISHHVQKERADICTKIIEDELLYSMIRPLKHSVLDWFEPLNTSEYSKVIKYPTDIVRLYTVPTSEVPSKIIENVVPIKELKNYGKRRLGCAYSTD